MTPRLAARSVRLAVAGFVALAVLVSTARVVAADDTTTTTATLPPAPAGFGASLVSLYQSALQTADALGQGSDLESLAQYQAQVSGFSDQDLAQLFYATQQVPEWSQLPSLLEEIAGDTPAAASQSAARTGGGSGAVLTAFVRPLRSTSAGALGAVLADTGKGSPVGPFQPTQCDTTDYDVPIFAAQIVLDVISGVYDAVNPFAHSEDPFTAGPVEDAISLVTAIAAAAAAVVHDTLVYLQTLENECQGNNQNGYLANIDNTTVTVYNLLTTIGTTTATIETNITNIQNQITSFQVTIEQALQSDTQALQATTGSDNQGTATEMQVIQNALQNDITTIESTETTNGQQVVTESTKTETTLSADLTQILNEVDTEAQGLTNLVTQGNQQILNALQTNFAATQQQYEANLQVAIEQGLAGWAPVVPEVQLILPASMGGVLNSTPVGVQEVVTSDIAALQAQGVKVKALAITDLAAANTALAAKQYTVAFSDYEQAYQAAA